MAEEKTFRDVSVPAAEIGIKRIGIDDLWQALKAGYDDFTAKPTHVAFICVIYPLFALLLTLFLTGENVLHLAFPVVSGFTLLGPVVAVCLFEMSRRRELGLDVTWGSAFGFVHSAKFAPILALSLLMMLLYVGWLYMAQLLYFGLFGDAQPTSVQDFVNQLMTTRHGAALIAYGTLIGFMFALVALAISVVAFPLLLDKPVTLATAVTTSIRAVAANTVTMAIWGLVVVALLAAGAALLLIGLAVVLPVLGHATWHLYRRLVEHD
ncbi:MAG TPA: DUF2189 domain-containing protein [Gammaproteobacteria bacterium]|nr:DUF2189 domain-containing protein [Gammaproteobacteria bacterium]